MALTTRQFPSSMQTSKKRQRECKTEVTAFPNLIQKVTVHHFCCILFLRSKSLGPAHTQIEGSIEGYDYKEVGIVGDILKHHTTPGYIPLDILVSCAYLQINL